MTRLWAAWPRLRKKIKSTRKKLLLLDFDGTLVGIARTPDAIVFGENTQALLWRLSARSDYRLAIVSGRSLADLKRHFNLKNVHYVGNHGLEMSGCGLTLPGKAKKARELKFLMGRIVEQITNDFYYMPGVLIEHKGFTVSLHFRNLERDYLPAFHEVLRFFREKYKKYPIVWKKGKMVWEIFPKIHWHKGHAAIHLYKKYPKALPLVVGDDRTDEDMFRAMRKFGITVRVGRSGKTCAKYYLDSQKEVDRLLEELCG
jgi:trehalose 6-phosphate phosphatase